MKDPMPQAKTVPIPSPIAPSASSDNVLSGQLIPAIDRIKLFGDRQWEEFILEWVDSLRDQYLRVDRCGGAGDMGRDIVGTVDANGVWDNYQCKHYKDPLTPA